MKETSYKTNRKNSARTRTRVRSKVICPCKKCRGGMVDPRTRKKHEQDLKIVSSKS